MPELASSLAHEDVLLANGQSGSVVSKHEQREFELAYSESLASILAELRCSLLVTTYMTGNLVSISERNGQIVPSFHLFDRPMGIAVNDNGIAVGSLSQVWFLRSAPDIAAKLEPHGQFDAGYFARYAHFTGDIHVHELAWVGSELWMVNTLFCCLCSPHPSYNFAPRWQPPFISALAPEDRCHLNGLAVADGQARFVSVMAETNTKQGWREVKKTAGSIIDVRSGETVVRGLSMPHSPRFSKGKLFFLHSGLGQLETLDLASGQRTAICQLPGYVRGLAIAGNFAFVGLSRLRSSSDWAGVPIAAHLERLKSGVWVIDLTRGTVVGSFEFKQGTDEVFDVQLLPGIRRPFIAGPMEQQPLWTVMPSPRSKL